MKMCVFHQLLISSEFSVSVELHHTLHILPHVVYWFTRSVSGALIFQFVHRRKPCGFSGGTQLLLIGVGDDGVAANERETRRIEHGYVRLIISRCQCGS